MKHLIQAVIIIGLLFMANSVIAAADQTGGQETPRQKSGAQIWTENCGTCHNLRNPAGYSDAEWEVAVQHMRIRANLTAAETRAIVEFLKSAN